MMPAAESAQIAEIVAASDRDRRGMVQMQPLLGLAACTVGKNMSAPTLVALGNLVLEGCWNWKSCCDEWLGPGRHWLRHGRSLLHR